MGERKAVSEDGFPRVGHCSVKRAAAYAECTEKTIRRWLANGSLRGKRPQPSGGCRWRVSVESLRELIGSD